MICASDFWQKERPSKEGFDTSSYISSFFKLVSWFFVVIPTSILGMLYGMSLLSFLLCFIQKKEKKKTQTRKKDLTHINHGGMGRVRGGCGAGCIRFVGLDPGLLFVGGINRAIYIVYQK